MTKRILCLVLALLMICALVSCGGKNSLKGKTLVMGTNAAFPPYEFVDDSNKIVGIDAEIAQAVADKLGMKLEIKDMAFDSLITAVSSGTVDIVLAGMTVTPEREESVNFTTSYATGLQVIIVTEDSAIVDVDGLDGAKIGVQSGTTGDIYCSDDYGEEAISRYDNGALAVAALQNGQVDCVVIDNEPAKAFVEANPGLKILDTEYVLENYAAAIAKNNTDLLDAVNGAIEELQKDGTIKAIIGRYIQA